MERQMWILSEPLGNEVTMRLKYTLSITTHLGRANRSSRTMALRPLHHGRGGHFKARSHGTNALAARHSSDNTLTKII